MAVVFGTTLRASEQAFARVAAGLAEQMEMPLRLVHVSEDARAPIVLATVLVIGSSSRKLRDVADRLSRASQVPVIVLRDPERLLSWLEGVRPLPILVGADFGRAAGAAGVFAASLADVGPTETPARSAVGRALLGSRSDTVIQNAQLPVILVPARIP